MRLILIALITVALAPAQQASARRRVPSVKSPEVLSDHRVVFRIRAPKATDVTVNGDWVTQGLGTAGKLEKDEQGVWSLTVGPLPPDVYGYNFTVDGVRILDPVNVNVKPGISSLTSMFEIDGDESAFEALRPVPHGEVHIAWYHSKALDQMRSMRVYTPPGYESGNAKYPVLYLLHGSGDEDAGWSTIGRANLILDNLLAANQAKPMIVVMPNGSMPRRDQPDLFNDELLGSVIPYVEQHYRVHANRDHRAIAGLSMGGGQTLRVGPSHLDEFAYMGVFSSGIRKEQSEDFEQRNAAFFADAAATNKKLKVFWIGVGEKDMGANPSAKNLSEILQRKGIHAEFHESAGGHTWINWRHYLNSFAPMLFR